MNRVFLGSYLVLLVAAASVACQPKTVTTLKQGADATKACGPQAMIDDCEDGNNQVLVQEGRSGYWYTFLDESGSTIDPPAGKKGGTFAMAEGGAHGSKYAARMKGKIGSGGVLFAGLGVNITDPKEAYDASKYGGVTFYAKKGAGSVGKVRLKIPDASTDPQGGVCKDCYNDFGATMELTDAWTRYELPFTMATQEPSWGKPRPSAITPSKLYALQWQVNISGADYEIWIDDVGFIGCQ